MRKQSNTLNFEGQNIYVGIDVHLKSWTVRVLNLSCVDLGWFLRYFRLCDGKDRSVK